MSRHASHVVPTRRDCLRLNGLLRLTSRSLLRFHPINTTLSFTVSVCVGAMFSSVGASNMTPHFNKHAKNRLKIESYSRNCETAAELRGGAVHPCGSLYHPVTLGVFAQRSLLVFRMADRLVSLCVFCLWPVNIAEG